MRLVLSGLAILTVWAWGAGAACGGDWNIQSIDDDNPYPGCASLAFDAAGRLSILMPSMST